jgi:hypothetical protein
MINAKGISKIKRSTRQPHRPRGKPRHPLKMTKPNLENNLIIEELQNERDRQEIEERFPCLKPLKISTNKPGTKVLTAKNKKKTMTLGVAILQLESKKQGSGNELHLRQERLEATGNWNCIIEGSRKYLHQQRSQQAGNHLQHRKQCSRIVNTQE